MDFTQLIYYGLDNLPYKKVIKNDSSRHAFLIRKNSDDQVYCTVKGFVGFVINNKDCICIRDIPQEKLKDYSYNDMKKILEGDLDAPVKLTDLM